MSKVLFSSAFAFALLVLCASGATAQRVGPVEDDAATDVAKPASEKPREAKPATKPDAKADTKADAKLDTKSDASSSAKPEETTKAVAAVSPDANAATEAKGAAKPDTKTQPVEERRDHKSAKKNSPASTNARATDDAAKSKDSAPANNANTTIPVGEKTALPASAISIPDSPAPDVTPTPAPLHGNNSNSLPPPPKYEPPAPIKAEVTPSGSATNNLPANGSANGDAAGGESSALSPTAIYRVGVGDILDIRLVGGMSKDYTLFTVLSNGTIDYPLAGEPVNVLNQTTDEINARLAAVLKRRGLFDRAQFQISVRDFTSHTVLVSGLVEQPGQKVLRREAVPLYVVLTEAFPRADAGRAIIISRASGATKTVDLADSGAMNELVAAGDVINVQPRPQEFFYIAGQVTAPGQKDFHLGMTLTQAILAAGGVTREAGRKTTVIVSRQGADGRLVPAEYALQEIQDGKLPDPRIQPGDRIEVGRRH